MATATMTSNTGNDALYKQKEENGWFNDGREEALLAYVQAQSPHSAAEVLHHIDAYASARSYLMNVGREKGQIVTSLIATHKPSIMVELGAYVGYSTVLFANALRQNGGKRYVSFERDAKFAEITRAMVQMAGLDEIVTIVVGSSSKGLVAEHAQGRLNSIDMVFLDHYKPAYVTDMKICESLGLIRPGTVLAADNVIAPGNPPYLEYVRSTPEQKMKKLQEREDETGEQFPQRTVNQYSQSYESDDTQLPGVPEIVYESHLIHSHEPTGEPDGVEVTVCKSVPQTKT